MGKMDLNMDQGHPMSEEEEEDEVVEIDSRIARALKSMVRIGKGKYLIRKESTRTNKS